MISQRDYDRIQNTLQEWKLDLKKEAAANKAISFDKTALLLTIQKLAEAELWLIEHRLVLEANLGLVVGDDDYCEEGSE